MERILYFLPKKPQPVYIRYGVTALIMLSCFLIAVGLESLSHTSALFLLLPGIFLAGVLFDQGSAFVATLLGLAATAYLLPAPHLTAGHLYILFAFAIIGLLIAIVSESLRNEMERAVDAERTNVVLLRELAHRTKNNLSILSAMVRLQAKDVNDAASALQATSERIQVLAEVYDHLTIRNETKFVDMRDYLEELCRKMAASISGPNPVALRVHSDEIYIHSERAVPLAIIVNELVTNSIKYAFPEGRVGAIEVSLRNDGELELIVADNGVGATDADAARGGVGSTIIALLTQQLAGTLTHDTSPGGHRAILRVPK
jgi:two-component sensor histidine kinase